MGLLGSAAPRGSINVFRGARRALAAAAAAATEQQANQERQLHQDWQALAFGYYEKLGECWNPAQFYARSMGKLDIFVGERNPDTGEVAPTTNSQALELFAPIQAAAKGETGLNASYGRLRFLIGEGRLCQSRPPKDQDPESASNPPVWEYLSPTELTIKDNGRRISRKDSERGVGIDYLNLSQVPDAGDPEPGQMRMWRMWRRHPRYSAQADSPTRGVLDLFEQLWWVTMGERADIQSRIANAGVWVVPKEIQMELADGEAAAVGEDPLADPFLVRIAAQMMAAISDPGSASAAVPVVIRGPMQYLTPDVFRHIKFSDPASSLFASQRERALIERISIGLDLPMEEVMGLSQANHWTAWKIDEEKWAHVEPTAQSWVDDLLNAVLRPLLIVNGVQNPDDFVVAYDNTDLVTDPDKGKTAITLHQEGLLKGEKTLEVNGFNPEEDLMDEEELERWKVTHGGSLTGDEPPDETPPEEGESEERREDTEDEQAVITGLAEFAVDRAREVAGARVRSLRRSCEDCFVGLDDVPNSDLIARLGREKMARLGAPEPAALVRGTVERFLATAERLSLTVHPAVALAVEQYAASTLYLPDPPPLDLASMVTLAAA